jgi:hypothetical protein
VTLEVYDSEDRHVEILFSPGKGESADITQSDVNRVLQTLTSVEADGDAADSDALSGTKEQKKPPA